MMPVARYFTTLSSPVGDLLLTSDGARLTGLYLEEHGGGQTAAPSPDWRRDEAPFREAATQLAEYFEGVRQSFSLPLAAVGTDFQRRVWAALAVIPFGETRSYGEIANAIGQPGSARAVGLANGQNPISIVVPCHRVIGANGTLTGYGGGLDRKRWLLEHEGTLVPA